MLNILIKFPKHRRIFKAIIFIMIVAVFFVNTKFALAGAEGVGNALTYIGTAFGPLGWAISKVLGIISYIIVAVIGLMITVVVALIIQVAQFNNIINVPTVITGWVIVRDLCNMSFILILLIIAFATILRQENFSAKKMLPKLLLMAILINFSRSIFGLLIDFSQVIMLTFVNAFSAGGGWFMQAFLVNKWFAIKDIGSTWTGEGSVDQWSTVIAIIAGVLAAIITLIVVSVMLAVLVARIVMLWIYTIFSPLIFLGFAFPPLQKYTGKLWEDFTKQLVVGPVLAFFIWLALTTAQSSSDLMSGALDPSKEQVCIGAGAFFCQNNFQKFIIVIGLLMGGLMVAQSMGGAAGSIAGKGLDWAKKSLAAPIVGTKKGARALARFGVDKLQQKGIVDLNLARAWRTLQENRKDKKSRMFAEGQKAASTVMAEKGRFRGLLAATAAPGDAWEQISSGFSLRHPFAKGLGQRLKGGKRMGEDRERLLPELEQAEFENKFSQIDSQERIKIKNELLAKNIALGVSISAESNPEKKKELEKEQKIIGSKFKFANDNINKPFTKKEREDFAAAKEAKQKEYDSNVPMYAFEAKSAEEKAVSAEADKIKKVDDKYELVRMLEEAIRDKEKSRIKAIMRKLTADYNDNEAFEALVPEAGTGYEGLQALMDGLSDKSNNKLYAGFDKQEAYSLGAQIAEMNKRTNHWEAAAAYKMERGEWKKTNAEEHAQIASAEFGKRSPRNNAREFNRLAMGKHVLNPKTGQMEYKLTDVGLIAMQSWDNPVNIDRALEDITESTAKYLLPFLDKLEAEGFFKAKGPKAIQFIKRDGSISDGRTEFPNLADMIRTKANQAREKFDEQFNYVSGLSEKINS